MAVTSFQSGILKLLADRRRQAGTCVMAGDRELYRGDAQTLADALSRQTILFHRGRIGGAWPTVA
jgi:hypothetical protein